MYPLKSYQSADRYSAKKNLKPINFVCNAPQANSVSVAGDFNQWDSSAHPLKKMPDGSWQGQIPVSHGHHRYVFMVDGVPTLDPKAQGVTRNDKNERVSLIAVS
jgi:1,4-alpha-glucan branching enzyme